MSDKNNNIDPVISFDETGVSCNISVSDGSSITVFNSWEEIFDREIEANSTDGKITVEDDFDGVEYLNNLSDSLKAATDMLEDKVRISHVLLLSRLIEGMNVEGATVSFNNYMKGEYD